MEGGVLGRVWCSFLSFWRCSWIGTLFEVVAGLLGRKWRNEVKMGRWSSI